MTTLNTNDFDFHLPEELIAQTPLEKRDASKLLMVNRQTGEFQDRHFHSIIEMLEPGDALVMNDTRVLPARLLSHQMLFQTISNKLSLRLRMNILPNTMESFLKRLFVPASGTLSDLVLLVEVLH